MKKLVLTTLIVIGSFVELQAQAPLKTLKVADGSLARCRTKADFHSMRNRSGVYRFRALGAEVEREKLKIMIALEFFKCTQSEDTYEFVRVSPYETLSYSHLGFHGANEVEVSVNEARLKAYKDGEYKILSDQEIENGNKKVHLVAALVDLEDVLNEQDNASVDFFLTKDLTYNNLTTGDSFRDHVAYGSFRVHLKVSWNGNGELKAFIDR